VCLGLLAYRNALTNELRDPEFKTPKTIKTVHFHGVIRYIKEGRFFRQSV